MIWEHVANIKNLNKTFSHFKQFSFCFQTLSGSSLNFKPYWEVQIIWACLDHWPFGHLEVLAILAFFDHFLCVTSLESSFWHGFSILSREIFGVFVSFWDFNDYFDVFSVLGHSDFFIHFFRFLGHIWGYFYHFLSFWCFQLVC